MTTTETFASERPRSRWHVCPECDQKFYLYIDARTVPTAYCSQRCEREAGAARYSAIYAAFYGED